MAWEVGTTLSVMPFGGPATLTIAGCEWDLTGETILPTSTRTLSNVTTMPAQTIAVQSGCVLVIVNRPFSGSFLEPILHNERQNDV